jgi:hypothetical protein
MPGKRANDRGQSGKRTKGKRADIVMKWAGKEHAPDMFTTRSPTASAADVL